MSAARQAMDFDNGLAILTEMIVSEIGPREALVHTQARIAAVARVERLLDALMAETPVHPSCAELHDGLASDILFGRSDAEFVFEDTRRHV